MNLDSIRLTWFRGAAERAELPVAGRSLVVYGANGSGKSSFVDAVEYAVEGRIRHLAHEYSGRRQENAVQNTHKPVGASTQLRLRFVGGTEHVVSIDEDGSAAVAASGSHDPRHWESRRTILRQSEVTEFIHDTKGQKYSALLPLLGLHGLEVLAENLRQLAREVEASQRLYSRKLDAQRLQRERTEGLGSASDDELLTRLRDIHAGFDTDGQPPADVDELGARIDEMVSARLEGFDAEHARLDALQRVSRVNLCEAADELRAATVKTADAAEPLAAERIKLLDSARRFAESALGVEEIACPACGQSVLRETFAAHVRSERERLAELASAVDERRKRRGEVCDLLLAVRSTVADGGLRAYLEGDAARHGAALAELDSLDIEELRLEIDGETLARIETTVEPLLKFAREEASEAPPTVTELVETRSSAGLIRTVLAGAEEVEQLRQVEALVSLVQGLERGVRQEIRERSERRIAEISSDVQTLWHVLHPDSAISGLRLYVPEGADKAIDIGLQFHGRDQGSPRLTLSEGYRNALGLCIFLAMARRGAPQDTPLILDDVVLSFDRDHRGMVASLLEQHFSDRQVVILTHDRDWYGELRHQLDASRWRSQELLPYESPTVGIRLSSSPGTFAEARLHLGSRPDSAANDARKIMDVELARIAQRLRVALPFLRGDKNDRRMAHDFLVRLVADGRKCFQIRTANGHERFEDGLTALSEVDGLLVSWANRGSHSFDVVRPEAEKLIDTCEHALAVFRCDDCGKAVWFADAANAERTQCECARLRWRYGKA